MKITLGELWDSLEDYPRLFKCHSNKETRLTGNAEIREYMERNAKCEVNSFSIFGYDGGFALEVIV